MSDDIADTIQSIPLAAPIGLAKQQARRLVLNLHLTLGLTMGALLTLVAVTGGLLVFYLEIDRLLTPALSTSTKGEPVPLARVVHSLRDANPQRPGGWRLELPDAVGHPIMARYMKPEETVGKAFAPLMVAVDPVTAEVVSQRFWGDTAMTWIYDLHYTLLAGDTGRLILSIASIASLVLVMTGIYLWWPAPGKFWRALRPKLRSGRVRTVFDLHVLAGIYGGVVLLPLIVTGIILEQPDWFTPAVERLSPLTPAADVSKAAGSAIDADAALALAQARFPAATPRWVEVPGRAGGAYQVRLQQPGEPSWRFPKTSVWINGGDGAVLDFRDAATWTAGDAFFGWQHPLHNGESFGLPGRVAVAATGLLPLVLLVTGFIRWRQKKNARQAAR